MQAIDAAPPVAAEKIEAGEGAAQLPTQQRADGSLVIDLTPLAPPPTECIDPQEPDPFNPEIVVCGQTMLSPRIGPFYGPSANELIEGSAIPRARLRLTEDAEAEANVTSPAVGGFHANGGEVRVKIDF